MAAIDRGTFDSLPGLSVEETRALRAQSDREHEFWQAHGRELRQKYSELAVAVVDGKVIDTDPDPIALIARLRENGHDTRKVWLKYFHKVPNNWAL